MVDATYVKVRKNGHIREQAVLVVGGVHDAGRREILTWRMADVESEDTWTEVFREQFEETLAVHDLPCEHRRRVYTTNIMERLMREIKRRTRVAGIFPNSSSCDRLVGAHFLERHESWQCERARYLVMDHLERTRGQGRGDKEAS